MPALKQPKNGTLSVSALERSIRQREFSPVYLLYGEEDFLLDEALTALIDASVDPATRSFNLDIVYGSETDAKRIIALSSSFPMMAERRVVIVREFDKLSNKDPLLSYIDHPSPATSLVLLASKPDFRLKFYKTLKDHAVAVESKPFYESDIPQWIATKVEQRGKHISPEACQLMLSYVGRSLREIYNEIEKLLLFVGGKSSIEADDVNEVVGMSRQYNVYELQNAVGAKDIGRALEISEHMIDAGEQPIGVIVMLTRYFRQLWVIKDGLSRRKSKQDIAALLGISPKQMYYLDSDLQKAQKFTLSEIEQSFLLLRDADVRLKTSAGDVKLVMTLLLYHIVRGEMAEIEA